MPEYDYVVPELRVAQEARFKVKELFSLVKNWFSQHKYDFYEKEYLEKLKETGKDISIKWETEKKVDDYTRVHIEIRVKFKNLTEEKGKKDIINKGEVSLKFESFLEKDYEANWEKNFLLKFLRELYNKFIARNKFDEHSSDLKEETYDLFNQVRAFLKIHKI